MDRIKGKILIVDDDKDVLETAKMFLKQQFETIIIDSDPSNIPIVLQKEEIDVVLLDMNFKRGKNDGEEGFKWLSEILKIDDDAVVILITAYGEVDLAVKAIKYGATDFVLKPWKNQKLLGTILSALELRKSKLQVNKLKFSQAKINEGINKKFGDFIGESPPMQRVYDLIEKVAETDANVLILGENGTGKELVARALHNKSFRKNQNFISVDLGSITETLFESELFGHVRGAFTDAKDNRVGSFELANEGTLFLDEIGNLSPGLQAKLLTVLQNRDVKRVGSNKAINVDIRLICATNMPLYSMVNDGDFRQDLIYRINTVEITLPSLRERLEDIPLLADHFLKIYSRKYQKQNLKISGDVVPKLKRYDWPGNIRELQHAVERAVILSDGKKIKPDDFLLKRPTGSNVIRNDATLNEMEKNFIIQALDNNNGNVTKTAKVLDLTRTALYRRLNKYGIN